MEQWERKAADVLKKVDFSSNTGITSIQRPVQDMNGLLWHSSGAFNTTKSNWLRFEANWIPILHCDWFWNIWVSNFQQSAVYF